MGGGGRGVVGHPLRREGEPGRLHQGLQVHELDQAERAVRGASRAHNGNSEKVLRILVTNITEKKKIKK